MLFLNDVPPPLVEQLTLKQRAAGSIPARATTKSSTCVIPACTPFGEKPVFNPVFGNRGSPFLSNLLSFFLDTIPPHS